MTLTRASSQDLALSDFEALSNQSCQVEWRGCLTLNLVGSEKTVMMSWFVAASSALASGLGITGAGATTRASSPGIGTGSSSSESTGEGVRAGGAGREAIAFTTEAMDAFCATAGI